MARQFQRRTRRLRQGARNLGDLLRRGRLAPPYRAPYDVVHEGEHYRLRRYGPPAPAVGVASPCPDDTAAGPPLGPLLLVPPLMVTAEIYDISPELSAVAALVEAGVDVWMVDFGDPVTEQGGLERTLDDHILAVSDAVSEVAARAGRAVHLGGYSQGGLFVYQAAAYRQGRDLASLVTLGSPVDMRRNLPVPLYEDLAERMLRSAWTVLSRPAAALDGLPGALTSLGFKLVSLRKELGQYAEFLAALPDREALERHEARRAFLGGEGFVAWPGPAFRTFVDEVLVANRLASGGFVVDGRLISLADLALPILVFVGERDDFAHPPAVRAIRRAAPRAEIHEVTLDAGHFGLVVGGRASAVTWPTVVEWIRAGGAPSATPSDASEAAAPRTPGRDPAMARVAALWPAWQRAGRVARELSALVEVARFDRPRRARLRRGRSRMAFGAGWALARTAEELPDAPFVIHGHRAFSLAEARDRVDRAAEELRSAGVRAGHFIGLAPEPSLHYLTAVCALSRLGAAVVPLADEAALQATTPPTLDALVLGAKARALSLPRVPRVIRLGETAIPTPPPEATETAPRSATDRAASRRFSRPTPTDVALRLPPRAGEGSWRSLPNRAWAAAALHTAVACQLRPGDTLFCALPLASPLALLSALPPALVARCRLALPARGGPEAFWEDVVRTGATVAFLPEDLAHALQDRAASIPPPPHRLRCLVVESADPAPVAALAALARVERLLALCLARDPDAESPLDLVPL